MKKNKTIYLIGLILVVVLAGYGCLHYNNKHSENNGKNQSENKRVTEEVTENTQEVSSETTVETVSENSTQDEANASEETTVTEAVANTTTSNGVVLPSPAFITSINVVYDDSHYEATLTSVGDIMFHSYQLERAYDSASDSFDFAESFEYVADYLSSADFTVGNLETTLSGKNNGYNPVFHGYSDYPCFNSPEIIAKNLKDLGVDMVGTANNHSKDSGTSGVYATLDNLDAVGLVHTGTARNQSEKDACCIQTVNGIKFGFCAYTYSLNGFSLDDDAQFSINTLKDYDLNQIAEMCQKVRDLRAAGADFVLVMLHAGIEYQEMPSSMQETLVDELLKAGTDVVLGSHPHVIEPMDMRTVTDENGITRQGIVLYSQGNFLSSQRYTNGAMKDIGMITNLTFTKEGDQLSITDCSVAPTYVYWTDNVIGIVPVIEAYNNRDKYSFLSATDWGRIEDSYTKTIGTLTHYGNMNYTLEDDNFYHFQQK